MTLSPAPRRCRVVVVEDEPDVRYLAITVLELAGDVSVVGQADTAEEGLWLCRSLVPDVLVTDLQLPGMSGEELIAAVERELPDVAIVVHSAHAEASELVCQRALGVCEVVPKNRVTDLVEVVHRCWSAALA